VFDSLIPGLPTNSRQYPECGAKKPRGTLRAVSAAPRLSRILETVLYYDAGQEKALESFYGEMLGLPRVGRGLHFRLGDGLLLLFDAQESTRQASPPAHGAAGTVHTCFVAPEPDYSAWKEYLSEQEIPLLEELTWENGVRSFYFPDPAGNVLEIADGDMWPRPPGRIKR
jgi:catechol 2,3-dioxygenase-like lactoylglutathione lyase family enzyme